MHADADGDTHVDTHGNMVSELQVVHLKLSNHNHMPEQQHPTVHVALCVK